ncbi:UNVERIFIED_CONTAM: hypothetical protein FKN15_022931 [Acipenser sinensis]
MAEPGLDGPNTDHTTGTDPTANDCDFEEDPCSWQQDPHNDFDWLRQQGSAGSGSIGPAGDHTTGRTRERYANEGGGGGVRFKLAMLMAHLDSRAVNRASPQNTIYMRENLRVIVCDVNDYQRSDLLMDSVCFFNTLF